MQRVKVYLKINDYCLNEDGFLNNNILSFNDKDLKRTNIIYNFNDNTLIRDNDEITIKMFFNKEKDNILYELKKEGVKIFNNFTNFSLQKEKQTVIINYRIEDANFYLKLTYKEV